MEYSHENHNGKVVESKKKKKLTFYYPCETAFECSPYELKLKRGLYFFEVYGAQGGNVTKDGQTTYGGKGGYSCGLYRIKDDEQILYLYIGGTSNSFDGQTKDIFNGGGKGLNIADGPGGGATDIRTIKGDDYESLKSRIIVAGAGGGAFVEGVGGNGGGLQGEIGQSKPNFPQIACVGTQSGCEGGKKFTNYQVYNEGSFGKGSGGYCGGGGGGYWGGGNVDCSGGSGGSGYIGGVFGHPPYQNTTKVGLNYGFGWAEITKVRLPNTNYINWRRRKLLQKFQMI